MVGYFVGFASSFVLNGLFTFRHTELSLGLFGKFLAGNAVLLLFVQVIQYILIGLMGTGELFGVAFGMVLYTSSGFIVNRRYILAASTNLKV